LGHLTALALRKKGRSILRKYPYIKSPGVVKDILCYEFGDLLELRVFGSSEQFK
jgi:hypothetical protein